MKGILIALLALVVGTVFIVGPYTVDVLNAEARQRNEIEAKQLDNTNQYDKMWKEISQVAQVTQEDRESLNRIFTNYAQARSGDGGDNQAVMKWIQETVPNVDNTTMVNLQNIIVSNRNAFTRNQTELLDLIKEHNVSFDVFPSNIVLSLAGRQKIEAKLVTSSRTEKAFETGVDDEVEVFKK